MVKAFSQNIRIHIIFFIFFWKNFEYAFEIVLKIILLKSGTYYV